MACRCERTGDERVHDAESLRGITSLECLFCPLYDVDTLLNGIDRLMSLHSSNPISDVWKRLIMNPLAIHRVLSTIGMEASTDWHQDYGHYRNQYVCFYIATRFYPTYMTWQAVPESPKKQEGSSRRPSSPEKSNEKMIDSRERAKSSPENKPNWWDINVRNPSDALRSNKQTPSFQFPWTELCEKEWKDALLQLYKCLWQSTRIDPIIVGFLIKITKIYIVNTPVFDLLSQLEYNGESWTSRVMYHAYYEDIGVLIHGLVHVGFFYDKSRAWCSKILSELLTTIAMSDDYKAARGELHSMTQARLASHTVVLEGLLTGKLPDTFTYLQRGVINTSSFEANNTYMQIIMNSPPEMRLWVLTYLLEETNLPPFVLTLDMSVDQLVFWNVHANIAMNPTPPVLVLDIITALLHRIYEQTLECPEAIVLRLRQLLPTLCTLINIDQYNQKIAFLASQAAFSDSEEDDSDAESRLSSRCASVTSPLRRNWSDGNDFVPLVSTFLVLRVVEAFKSMIALELWDSTLAENEVVHSLLALYELKPAAGILHNAVTDAILTLLNRPNGKANNILLRSAFRGDNLLTHIQHGLSRPNAYHGQLSRLGMKIHQICSAPTLHQELVRQYCQKCTSWVGFINELVAQHYRLQDELAQKNQRKRLESFGSAANIVEKPTTNLYVIAKSRENSQTAFPITEDELKSLDNAILENSEAASSMVFQKISLHQWQKVHLALHKFTCSLKIVTDKKSRLFSMSKKSGFSMVACHVSEYIVYGQTGAYGFQVVGFDTIKEVDVALTFVVATKQCRDFWVTAISSAIHIVTKSADINEEVQLNVVRSIVSSSTNPFVITIPQCSQDFKLCCEVPEDIPFWGKYYGPSGLAQFLALVNAGVQVAVANAPKLETIGHAVFAEYAVIFTAHSTSCECVCRDIYTFEQNAVVGLTRSLVDADKLVKLLEHKS
ncbi:hypothetical protein THRCLA_02959 [Thraustotheca clavata]|uniref:PH domain-containing protein n=1 Tax=Thraustotheca clavata TaxID=74557 RepID=A0A1W0A3H1_9STRA|nr:hypothetical protein THRCLA_02959 [Thraustotheca clavata]